jgi:hypothetical protein
MFAPDAVITTPLRGASNVRDYHEWLFATVKKSTVKVQNVFQALNGDICIAVHSQYEWLLNNDNVIHFGGMSVFEFTQDRRQIKKMSTFYDTSAVRIALAEANSLPST